MVVPVIAGAARVVSAGVKTGRRAKAAAKRPELLRKVRARQRIQQRQAEPLTAQQRAAQTQHAGELIRGARALHHATGKENSASKIRAVVATVSIFWWVWPYYIPQFFFWLLGLAALGLEVTPIPVVREIISFVIPGQEIFLFSYMFIAMIGLGSMTYAAWVYTLRGIRPFEGIRMLAFAICFTGYLTFFLNLFPWVFLWTLIVIHTEKKETGEEA